VPMQTVHNGLDASSYTTVDSSYACGGYCTVPRHHALAG
jgi:hypothetical protein